MGEQSNNSARSRATRGKRRRKGGTAALAVVLGAASLLCGSQAVALTPHGGSPAVGHPPAMDPDLSSVTVSRISASDRYELAVEVAKRVSPGATNIVYLASGASFPDALSAGPAATVNFAPLLLVSPDAVPEPVAGALARMDPIVIYVVGGPTSVSDTVITSVHSLAPHAAVFRISGADRYAVSRAVVTDAFSGGATDVYVATGRDFPDALSAGSKGIPVVLVDGLAPVTDDATQSLLRHLGTRTATIVGGRLSVSTGIESTILPGGWVPRVAGVDRYHVSLLMAGNGVVDYATVYLVTGSNFPDALAGGVLAAKTKSPMFVVPSNCVPQGVLSLISGNGTKDVVLIGGPTSLGVGVATLTPCSF